jgi:hypothetical protein
MWNWSLSLLGMPLAIYSLPAIRRAAGVYGCRAWLSVGRKNGSWPTTAPLPVRFVESFFSACGGQQDAELHCSRPKSLTDAEFQFFRLSFRKPVRVGGLQRGMSSHGSRRPCERDVRLREGGGNCFNSRFCFLVTVPWRVASGGRLCRGLKSRAAGLLSFSR